jgi:hypothetical protein
MQPYKRGSDAESDPVSIVHDLDRFDKHRELAIVVSCANVLLPPNTSFEAVLAVTKSSQGEALTSAEFALVSTTLKQNAKVLPQIAFPHLGKWKVQSVVPMLSQLHEAIFKRVDSFEGLV